MTKQQIRKQLALLRAQPSVLASLPKLSVDIVSNLEGHPLFQSAQCVLLYHSLPDEVDTHELIRRHTSTKTVLLPTVVGDQLELHLYAPQTPTQRGPFGIEESQGPLFPPSQYHQIDLAIIPGVAFDRHGHRLGRGRGYYDRLLPQLHCPTLGLCFPFQIIDAVPHEAHDIPVDAVVSN